MLSLPHKARIGASCYTIIPAGSVRSPRFGYRGHRPVGAENSVMPVTREFAIALRGPSHAILRPTQVLKVRECPVWWRHRVLGAAGARCCQRSAQIRAPPARCALCADGRAAADSRVAAAGPSRRPRELWLRMISGHGLDLNAQVSNPNRLSGTHRWGRPSRSWPCGRAQRCRRPKARRRCWRPGGTDTPATGEGRSPLLLGASSC